MSGTDGGQHRGSEPHHVSCDGRHCGGCSSLYGGGCVLKQENFNPQDSFTYVYVVRSTFVVIMVVVGMMVMIVVVVMMMVVMVVNLPSN